MNAVALGYVGVHQIFQLALAAQEANLLDGLFVSACGNSGVGRVLRPWIQAKAICPLDYEKIGKSKIWQYPFPLISRRFVADPDCLKSNSWFDRRMARWLANRKSRVFVGVETCCLESFRTAKDLGMTCVLECPGVPSIELDRQAKLTAERFNLTVAQSSNSSQMLDRKRFELELADAILCCSDYQAELLRQMPEIKPTVPITVVPLWCDVEFWEHANLLRTRSDRRQPLRVLYAGAISLRKGIPYLLEAAEAINSQDLTLTLVGKIADELKEGFFSRYRTHKMLGPVTKADLRQIFAEHDVLVAPTLGDSFGFVALEAMASGMPVIASEHLGAPLPDASWRIRLGDESLCKRLREYCEDRESLKTDGEKAAQFARIFTPAAYRRKIGLLLMKSCIHSEPKS